MKQIDVLRTFISKYTFAYCLNIALKPFLVLLFTLCIFSHDSYSQENCNAIIIDYERVVCNEEPIQFVLKTKGACTIENIVWIFNNTTNNIDTIMGAGPHLVTFLKPGLTYFSISYFDFTQQTQIYKELSFNVIEPVVGITIEPQKPCIGELIKLKANGPEEGFFVWKGAIEKKGEKLFEVIDSVRKDNQEYTLQWFLGTNNTSKGCRFRFFTDSVETRKMTPLIIDPSNEINICEGEEVKLTIQNTNSSNNYIWRSENLVVSNTSLNIKPESTTEISVSTFENGCFKSENITINVQQVPSFSIQPTTATICEGSSLALNILTDNFENEISYTWAGGQIIELNALGDTVEITPASSTTYTASWEHEGCKATANAIIETSENVTNVITDRTINICSGEEIKLSVNAPTRGTIKWYNKDFSNPNESPTITVSPEKTTVYEVKWTDGQCTDSGIITVNVNPKPEINIVSPAGSRVCKGEHINLKVLFSNGAFNNNFSWSLDKEQEAVSINNHQLSFTATQSSNVTAVWLDSQEVCKEVVTQNFYFDVLTKPETISLKADKQELCEGEIVELDVSGSDLNNFILYNAYTEEKISDKFEDGIIRIAPTETTNYIAWWLSAGCRILSDTVKVIVNEIPSITVNNNEKICPNSSFEINIQPTEYSVYLWSGGDIPNADLVAGFKLNRKVDETNLDYSLRISDNECVLDTLITLDLVNLDVKAISDKPNNEVCEGEPVQLYVDGADSYLWETNEIITGDLSNNPVAFPIQNLTELNVKAYKDGCPVDDVLALYLKEKPNASIIEQNTTICYGDTVQLEGNGGQNYFWKPKLFLNNSEIQNPISTPNESISYTLTVIAENGCTDEAEVTVNVQNNGCEINLNRIFIPNTITPNGDNINDNWEIPAIADLQDYEVSIFTDFGAIVFNKVGYQNEFNGLNGGFLPTGTYYYIIRHLSSENKKTGTLTIIR